MATSILICPDQCWIGERQYMNDEGVDPVFLDTIRNDLAEELAPGETRAKLVAEAIFNLHEKAMSSCISDQPLDSYVPPIEDEVIERCRIALVRAINKSKKSKKRKGKRNVH